MDILGLSRRMFDQIGQMSQNAQVRPTEATQAEPKIKPPSAMSSLSERLDHLAQQFDVKAMPVSELVALQESLTQSGFIGATQVRAQGLLPQLAFHHYQAGPMDVESALEEHIKRLKDQPAVLADYNESKHVLNVVRNLSSARTQAA